MQSRRAYRDIGAIKHKDYVLHLLDINKGEKVLDVGCEVGAMIFPRKSGHNEELVVSIKASS
jgi:cyclopropane fatty-acyl-phospholipid synthase-like methyltransferase